MPTSRTLRLLFEYRFLLFKILTIFHQLFVLHLIAYDRIIQRHQRNIVIVGGSLRFLKVQLVGVCAGDELSFMGSIDPA